MKNFDQRGRSLFRDISASRTCDSAGIAPHWCVCLNWQSVSLSDERVQRSAKKLVEEINTMTSKQRTLCDHLKLTEITDAVTYTPNDKLLKFKFSKDVDGRVPDLSGTTNINEVFYQITVSLAPGNGLFEATIRHHITDDSFHVSPAQISRINKYGNQPHCIQQTLPHLRQYCYCTVQL